MRNTKERICAFLLAFLLLFSSLLPHVTGVVKAQNVQKDVLSFFVYEQDTQNTSNKIPQSDALVKIYKDGESEPVEIITTDQDGNGKIENFDYDDQSRYYYEVEKKGFETSSKTEIINLGTVTDPIETEISMSEIAISQTTFELNLTQGGNIAIAIQNQIQNQNSLELPYTWSSDNATVADVDQNGVVTGKSKGKATITIARNGKQMSAEVLVKEELTNMNITATPGSGEENTTDQDSVDIAVMGIPADAKGIVNVYQETKQTQIGTINAPYNTPISYDITSFTGKTVFIAEYVPAALDDYYFGKEVSTNEITYRKTLQLVLNETSKSVIYGDQPPQIGVDETTRGGRTLSYSSSNTNVAAVDEVTGQISIEGAGETTITVTANENDNYTVSTASYTLTVTQKSINAKLDEFKWYPASKVYNGKSTIILEGILENDKNSGIEIGDIYRIETEAKITKDGIEATDKGIYSGCEIENLAGTVYEYKGTNPNNNDKYNLTVDTGTKVTLGAVNFITDSLDDKNAVITVEARPIYVQIKRKQGNFETSAVYGDDILEAVQSNSVELAGTYGQINASEEQGIVNNEKINLDDYTSIELNQGNQYFVGEYDDAIVPKIDNEVAGNYLICLEKNKNFYGRLEITRQITTDEYIKNMVSVDEEDGIYKTADKIWVRGNSVGVLKFSLTETAAYNKIAVSKDGGKEYMEFPNDGGLGIQFDDKEDKDKNLNVYLKNTNDITGKTRTVNEGGNDNNYKISVDAERPKVTFSGPGTFGLYSKDSQIKIPFNHFTNTPYDITVSATDSGSGLKSLSTKVVSVKNDNLEELQRAVFDNTGWAVLGEAENKTVINIDSQGNQIVLAKVRDYVGNEAVYTSNGLVYETNKPKININCDLSKPIGSGKYFNYNIEINDLSDINSGINNISIKVYDREKKEENKKIGQWNVNDKNQVEIIDSYDISSDEIDIIAGTQNDNKTTLDYLRKRAVLSINGLLTVGKFQSNNAIIEITVTDNAGNVSVAEKSKLKLDNKAPFINVGYSNYDAQSDYYYDSYEDRKMTITYQERNFIEEGLFFYVEKNGVKVAGQGKNGNLTYEELANMEGIETIKISDSQAGVAPEEYTDDRKNIYEIHFSEDGAYKIIPYATDMADNLNAPVNYQKESKSNELFVIDTLSPTVNLSYNDYNASNNNYFKSREMTIVYGERNFDKKLLSFDMEINGDKVKGSAEGGRLTYEEIRKVEGIMVGELSDPEKDFNEFTHTSERKVTCVIKFEDDDCYKLIPYIKDKAGNNAENIEDRDTWINYGEEYLNHPANVEFFIDHTVPTVEVKYNDDKIGVNNKTYFKDQRTMNIIYTDRNYSKEGLRFRFKHNGEIKEDIGYDELAALAEKEDSGFVISEKLKDSESNVEDSRKHKDDRKITFSITFGKDEEDHDYMIEPYITDLAGNDNRAVGVSDQNQLVNTGEDFTVDMLDPVITVKYYLGTAESGKEITSDIEKTVNKPESDWYYTNQTITAVVSIDERNFNLGNMTFSNEPKQVDMSVKTSYEKNAADIKDYAGDANRCGNWKREQDQENTYTQQFDFIAEADYALNFKYVDLAGNTCSLIEEILPGDNSSYRFVVDRTAPTGTIKIVNKDGENVFDRLINQIKVFFGIYDNKQIKIEFTSEDITSIYTQKYYMYDPGDIHGEVEQLEIEDKSVNASEMTLERISINDWIGESKYQRNVDAQVYKTAANTQQVPYMRLEDKAGNVAFFSSDGVIDDRTAPEGPSITITTPESKAGYYNGNVNFTIDVKDSATPDSARNKTYSGLKEVSYKIYKDGNSSSPTQTGNYNSELTARKNRIQSLVKRETINASLNNSNRVTIEVRAVDYAGNESVQTKEIKIDITAPRAEISFDLNNPLNGKYYNATRTATVTVYERNFDPNDVHFTITNTDGSMPSISGWSIGSQTGVSDDTPNTCTVSFSTDGDYTMAMECTDLAGNGSNRADTPEFTIDKTVPTISVAFDNNNALNGKYYSTPRTATITVNEHNFNGSEVQTAINATLQSQGITPPGVNGWSGGGDIHTATVHFGTDGDYSFNINYTDMAGNPATVYNVEQFTIDQTKPEIEIFDVIDKSANNGLIEPGVRYSDVNYDTAGVEITIEGANHGKQSVDGTRSSIPNGESIKMADFIHEKEMDDVYTLTAKVTDRAGNSDEKSVVFSVNRFGSTYEFSSETKSLLSNYYSNKEKDLVIIETNVDTLEHRGISYGRDGELVTLEEGKDYQVRESGSEVSWKRYEYTIPAKNFEKEGRYNITIDSVDRAENEVNNKVKNTDIEFVIDKTAPSVVITGIENRKQYRSNSRDVVIKVTDNIAIGDMDVYVDENDSVKHYDEKTIRKQKGEVVYTLDSSTDWQKIKAIAADAAGNSIETGQYSVLITSNILVQFYRNTPLFIGSIITVAAIIGFGIFLFIRRRRTVR